MIVPNSHGWLRQRWRPTLAAILMLSGLSGSAQAVEFDATIKAPMMKDTAELKVQAQNLATRYSAVREASPEMLIKDAALARQQFDLKWQLQQAINDRKPMDELETLGLKPRGDGGYNIDVEAHPEWVDLPEIMAGVLRPANLEAWRATLVNRGFRPQDIETIRDYVTANNPANASASQVLPLTLNFGRVVGKFDKAKRPLPDGLVISYFYQRGRANSESNRLWVENLFKRLDAQRVRVLLSTFLEMKPMVVWLPDNVPEGVATMLAAVRLPDFESRVAAEAKEAAP